MKDTPNHTIDFSQISKKIESDSVQEQKIFYIPIMYTVKEDRLMKLYYKTPNGDIPDYYASRVLSGSTLNESIKSDLSNDFGYYGSFETRSYYFDTTPDKFGNPIDRYKVLIIMKDDLNTHQSRPLSMEIYWKADSLEEFASSQLFDFYTQVSVCFPERSNIAQDLLTEFSYITPYTARTIELLKKFVARVPVENELFCKFDFYTENYSLLYDRFIKTNINGVNYLEIDQLDEYTIENFLPELVDFLEKKYDDSVRKELTEHQGKEYTLLSDKMLLAWFRQCWKEAGGGRAHTLFSIHDERTIYDLNSDDHFEDVKEIAAKLGHPVERMIFDFEKEGLKAK